MNLVSVKKNYDLVKQINKGALILRDDVAYSLDEALFQIPLMFSYAYGDYSIVSDATYSFTDTVTLTFTVTIGDMTYVPTKQDDKITFPNSI